MGTMTTRDGCDLRYTDSGSPDPGAETVVLLSGWSQTADMFSGLVERLAGRYRVVALDYRNHGRSGDSEGGARVATLAADLRELLDHLAVDRAHLLGSSLGCSVLWSFVDSHGTDRIRTLTLVDQPSACTVMPWFAPGQAGEVGAILDFAGAEGFVAGMLGEESDAVREAFLRSMLYDGVPEDVVSYLLGQNMQMRLPYGARLLLDHVMQDWRDVLPLIDVPTLVTGGEESHVDQDSQRWIADQIPGARLHVFTKAENGDHFPFLQNPDRFAEVLTDFLESSGR